MCSQKAFITLWLTAAALSGCQQSDPLAAPKAGAAPASAAAPLVRVTPIQPQRKTLVRKTEQPGEIQAFEETPLHAKVSGYVKQVLADIGDRVTGPQSDKQGKVVREGQVLVELSIPEMDEELNQKHALVGQASAEIQQAAAAVKVAEAAHASAAAKVVETQAALERDQAQFDRWKSEYTRMADLAANKAVSQKLVEETQNQFRAAEAARRETGAKIKSAEAQEAESAAVIQKSSADVEAAKAKHRVAQADEKRMEALVSYGRIRAPYDGIVTVRNIHTGHLVQSASGATHPPLLVLVRTDIVRIFVDVPETDAVLIKPNSEAQVRVLSLSAEVFPARLTRSAWVLNSGTRTLRTELDVNNATGRLRPGMYANAEIIVAERPNALVLPKSAVISQGTQTFCYSIDAKGKIVPIPVVLGIQAGNEVEIVSGLKGDESVIGLNLAAFRAGDQVEVVRPPEKGAVEKK